MSLSSNKKLRKVEERAAYGEAAKLKIIHNRPMKVGRLFCDAQRKYCNILI
ncbi:MULTISPECIES: hypothetical protein [unclassified Ruminococcus]|uniref:hypothetical protein n=1 Tax=unclassified Ruminococcus TaxID=2608920 RepID=UPI00210D318C|nr:MULTISPECIES: hypothetical protein [unclassified Ruminococcus]MCQ4023174.1 hypothetical protein [Ruminococcus sp. zg-924]MCQ4115392.1 hypothetical protein [Ruminococcus sp. zg-921]